MVSGDTTGTYYWDTFVSALRACICVGAYVARCWSVGRGLCGWSEMRAAPPVAPTSPSGAHYFFTDYTYAKAATGKQIGELKCS